MAAEAGGGHPTVKAAGAPAAGSADRHLLVQCSQRLPSELMICSRDSPLGNAFFGISVALTSFSLSLPEPPCLRPPSPASITRPQSARPAQELPLHRTRVLQEVLEASPSESKLLQARAQARERAAALSHLLNVAPPEDPGLPDRLSSPPPAPCPLGTDDSEMRDGQLPNECRAHCHSQCNREMVHLMQGG